jgi:hypothetical protein
MSRRTVLTEGGAAASTSGNGLRAVGTAVTPHTPASGWPFATALMVLCGLGLVFRSGVGDYSIDAGPAVDALVRGDLHGALELQPLMGSFSVLLRAPFAFVAEALGVGHLWVYRAGLIPCVAATAVVGAALARARAAGNRELLVLVPLLAVLSPASLAAVRYGHPEELLTAALCVGAVLLAMRGHGLAAGVVLGLALASKQWAVIAFLPVLLAVRPGLRVRAGLVAVATALVLTVPLLVGHSGAFGVTAQRAAAAPPIATPATVWFLAAKAETREFDLPKGFPSKLTVYRLPAWVGRVSHPLIVLLSLPLTLALWRRRPHHGDVLALLALLFLFRCTLDPVDNEYYHAPLLLSLLAWEVTTRRLARGVPLATVAAATGLWLTFEGLAQHGVSTEVTNAVYLAWTTALAAYLLHVLRLLPGRRLRRAAAAA